MVSDKQLFQNFSDFRGLDVRSSDLNRPPNFAKEVKNFIIEKSFSLGGEKGIKIFADFKAFPQFGLHTYRFKDPETSLAGEELLCIGTGSTGDSGLKRLTSGTFGITYSGSDTWGYEFLLEGGVYRFKLYDDGVEVLDYSIGTGFEDSVVGKTLLSSLEAEIDAISNFSATSDSTVDAIIAAAFPLGSAYSQAPGSIDFNIYYWEDIPFAGIFSINGCIWSNYRTDQAVAANKLGNFTFLNKNNVCYIASQGKAPLMKYDGSSVRGVGVRSILDGDIEVSAVGGVGTPLVGTFRYYIRIVTKDAKGNFIYGAGAKSPLITTAAGEAPGIDLFKHAAWITSDLMRLGLSTLTVSSNTITFAAWPTTQEGWLIDRGWGELKAGDFINLVQAGGASNHRRIVSIDRANFTITFDGSPVSMSAATACYWAGDMYQGYAYCVTNTAQPNVSTFTVTIKKGLAIGQYLFFEAEQRWYKIIALGASTVTIDGVVSIPSGSQYFFNMKADVYRTEDGGIEKFYLVEDISYAELLTTSPYVDETPDANLGEELIIPLAEADHLREAPSIVIEHQGVMVTAGGTQREGRIHFEDVEYIESFPLATNFYDVPLQTSGTISALWPDGYDQLAVFKEAAYCSVKGSFTDEIPLLNTEIVTEDDIGVSSQNSLVKVRGVNIGVGPLGFVAFRNGVIDYEFTKQLDSEFLAGAIGSVFTESEKLRIERSYALNDKFKQQAYFFIPAITIEDGDYQAANENSKFFILDYSEQTWTTREFPANQGSGYISEAFYPSGGMALYQNRVFFLTTPWDPTYLGGYPVSYLFRRKDRDVIILGEDDYRQDYSDNHLAINYNYKSQWLWVETPSNDKLFHWLFIYSFPTADFVPFDLRVRTYLDFNEDVLIDDVTLSFDATTKFRSFKLQANKGKSLLVRFTTNTLLQKPTIMGYEVIPGEVDLGLEGVR